MVALLILLLILPAPILFLIHRRKLQKSSPPPGPTGLPFIGNLLQFDTAAPHLYLYKLSHKYGPLISFKLGCLPAIAVSSPELAKEVLKTKDGAFCSRPKLLGQQKLSYNGADVGFVPYSESWRQLRKVCVLHLLSHKQVQSFRPIREDEVFRMISSVSSGEVCNFNEIVMDFTSTLTCRIAFGKERDGDNDKKRMRVEELLVESQAMHTGFFFTDYLPLFSWVDRISGMIGRLDRVCKDFDDFFTMLIDEHLDPRWTKSTYPNILDLLIQLKQENSSPIALTWDHAKALLFDVFVGGTETSAVTIIWSMTALKQNPTTMKKLQKEIRELVGNRGQVKDDDIPKLPYLHAVVKEALRLYPPAPLLIPRESIQDCNLHGYDIPAKTLVYINAWAIARDPKNWENPNEFVPERFMNSKIDIVGQDFEVIPFGGGRRGCPGITMGLATVELALANLTYSFDWELPKGMKKEDIDTQVLPGITMHKKVPLCLVPINRHGA